MRATVLTDKPNGNNAEWYERVKLAVVAGDDLGGELLRERNADTIGQRDPAPCLMPADALPKTPAHIATLDHAISVK